MVKFITKTVCMALIAALCVMNLNAQSFERKVVTPKGDRVFSMSAKKAEAPMHRGVITDDVEGHTAWTIDSPGSVPWSYYNGNPSTSTYGFETSDFPNSGSPMAFIVFKPSETTPPLTSSFPPHSGSQFFACFNIPSALTNAWLISPKFTEVEGTASISFWARSLTNQYGAERFKVAVSTTGTAPTDFTTVISPGSYVTTTEAWVQYTYNIPSTAKYVAINCCSQDAFALFIDDITINGVTTSGVEYCPEVTNLQAEKIGADVKLTWTAATGSPTGYKIYDGTTVLAPNVTATEYMVTGLSVGPHTLGVEAIYSDGCVPVKVTTDVTIPSIGNPIKNLDGKCEDGTVTLNWDAPDPNNSGWDDWFTYLVGDYAGGLGSTTGPANMAFANRWSPADLAAKGITTGAQLTKITHFFNTSFNGGELEAGNYTVKVWQGESSTTAGTEKYSGATLYYPGDLIDYEWNEVTLSPPLVIDASLELWFGFQANITAGISPACPYGTGGYVNDVNMVRWNNSWSAAEKLVSGGFSSGNWALKGWVISEGGDPIEISHYDVIEEGTKIDEVAATATTYTKTDVEGNNTYCIVAVYEDDAVSTQVCQLVKCDLDPCKTVGGAKAKIDDCKEATITWNIVSGAVGFQVLRDGIVLGTVTTSKFVEEADFVKGETYEWEIVTLCEKNQSEPVKVTATSDCEIGINELTNNVAIYPNPTNGTINIEAANFAKVEVYNTIGQLVETKTVPTFDVSSYNTGVYFFKVYDNDNNSVTKRVMVTK